MAGPAQNLIEFTVSELSAAVKRAVEDGFSYVRVRGEISGYRGPHSSGHAYFSLKDDKARLEAVVWRLTFQKLRFKPTEGMEVIATGRLTTFPGSSKYQMVIDLLEPAGRRRADGAPRGAAEEARRRGPVRREPQAPPPLPAAGDRRRHLADRRGDPRHPAPALGSLPGPRRALAGEGAGRDSGAEVAAAIRGFNALARRRPRSGGRT